MSSEIHIPGYTLVNKIAEGGMAMVWKARQDKLDRIVAIKLLMKQSDSDPQEFERFIYEARAAAILIHPNIVQVIDAGESDGFLYYVMEYVPGPTAGELVDQGAALPEAQVLHIAQEVAEALDYAWRDHHVVHCDIKPDNLLLHRNGRTKIADLGLAQVLGSERVAIEEGMTLGTPNYFPPEQALVEDELDCRTDMYALGATMYHLGTGKVPFGQLSPDEVASQQVHGQLPNPHDLNPSLSWGFCCMVERMMAKDPSHRYADWPAVLADLQQVKAQGRVAHPLPPSLQSTVIHTNAPAEASDGNGPKRIRRQRGAAAARAPRRRRGSAAPAVRRESSAPIARRTAGHPAAGAAVPPQGVTVPTPGVRRSVWPWVVALALIVGVLYAYTFTQTG